MKNITRRSPWYIGTLLGCLVAGVSLFFLAKNPAITMLDFWVTFGAFDSYNKDADGSVFIQASEDPRLYKIASPYAEEYFEEELFVQEVHQGDKLRLTVLGDQYFGSPSTVAVFGLEANEKSYLPLSPMLESYNQTRLAIYPTIIPISIIFAAFTFFLGRKHERAKYGDSISKHPTYPLVKLSFYIGMVGSSVLAINLLLWFFAWALDNFTIGILNLLAIHFAICFAFPGLASIGLGILALVRYRSLPRKGKLQIIAGILFGLFMIGWVVFVSIYIAPAIAEAF